MEREYITHLEKSLEESNKLLKSAIERISLVESSLRYEERERQKYERFWHDEIGKNRKLNEELEAQKKEQEAVTSNSSDNLKEAI